MVSTVTSHLHTSNDCVYPSGQLVPLAILRRGFDEPPQHAVQEHDERRHRRTHRHVRRRRAQRARRQRALPSG
jgi:hypothetical protein